MCKNPCNMRLSKRFQPVNQLFQIGKTLSDKNIQKKFIAFKGIIFYQYFVIYRCAVSDNGPNTHMS